MTTPGWKLTSSNIWLLGLGLVILGSFVLFQVAKQKDELDQVRASYIKLFKKVTVMLCDFYAFSIICFWVGMWVLMSAFELLLFFFVHIDCRRSGVESIGLRRNDPPIYCLSLQNQRKVFYLYLPLEL